MKRLFLIAAIVLGTFAASNAQTTKKAELVADETTVTELKSSIKVQTSNERIFKLVLSKYKTFVKRYSVEYKTDRAGEYIEYTIPFKLEQLPEVKEFLTSL